MIEDYTNRYLNPKFKEELEQELIRLKRLNDKISEQIKYLENNINLNYNVKKKLTKK